MTKKLDLEMVKNNQRNKALRELVSDVPYAAFLGVHFDSNDDRLTSILPYSPKLIGNPALPAVHGGVTASFLEITAILELYWISTWQMLEIKTNDALQYANSIKFSHTQIPKTINFTVDYLRPGLAKDSYARAEVKRVGRRYASVYVEAWQGNKQKLFAQASGHFLMPVNNG